MNKIPAWLRHALYAAIPAAVTLAVDALAKLHPANATLAAIVVAGAALLRSLPLPTNPQPLTTSPVPNPHA